MRSELSIHLPKKDAPKLHLKEYKEPPAFTTIQIVTKDSPTITFFVYKLEDVVAFKNNVLWTFEKYMKERTS